MAEIHIQMARKSFMPLNVWGEKERERGEVRERERERVRERERTIIIHL